MAVQTWEYQVVELEQNPQVRLDELGRDGWELVAVAGSSSYVTLYLKRPTLSFKEQVTLDQRAKYAAQRGDTLDDPSFTGQEG